MMEMIVATIIVALAGYIIFRSLKNSSKGKCNCGCSGCKAEKICSDKNNIKIK
ncbi:FeoB-associated Cys-rich membrane protein [Clostridium sp.]|jgi:hypothetical protein|uniref:FeoB-associated Cys-rich membrane protein n=1 Tax=Clostridium sp. TaxID=1506 RepID=UPI00284E3EAD|nr:FeoB-associated Cys-rich membrane protein [Clostridium sp.]MDR3597476.1 FeoB-associated Cys-rich membrane protein [Clostridium sp.]